MIGNSLSFCVRDITEGKVQEDEVEKIRCSFKAPVDEMEFVGGVIQRYQEVYWSKFKEEAAAIALRLYRAGKLEFTDGHYLPPGKTWGDIELQLSN